MAGPKDGEAPGFGIVNDLMEKCALDVQRTIMRTLSICPRPHLPVAMAGGTAAIGIIAGVLDQLSGEYDKDKMPDPRCILLAGLICARMAIHPQDGLAQAYRDLDQLMPAAQRNGDENG